MSAAYFMIRFDSDLAVQSWVRSVNISRQNTWGAPVFSVMVPEVLLIICTDYGLSVRKSRIQWQIGVLRPSRERFLTSY